MSKQPGLYVDRVYVSVHDRDPALMREFASRGRLTTTYMDRGRLVHVKVRASQLVPAS